jgi:cation diffusion facilitator CzcD-associated flavoprotein CzcO
MSQLEAECPVIIVGGGASGLSTAGALSKLGIRSTILDQDDRIGSSWERRYECLKLHTIRRYSGLAHYPIPRERPRYLSKDEYAAYLREYAEALGLDVSLGERVNSLQKITNNSAGMTWELVTNAGKRRSRIVVIATGHYSEANIPTWEGIKEYSGEFIHTSQYTSGAAYEGKKVLVIGLGNSGAEIAADLSRHGAASVSVSVRTPPPIVNREMFKVLPVQVFGIALSPLRIPRIIDGIGALLRRISIGDLSAYGLGKAEWGPFTVKRPAVIDAGFVEQLKQGRIQIEKNIVSFDKTGVLYADGSRESVDVIIAATGFRTGLDKLLKVAGVIDDKGQPLFRSGRPTSAPGLYFVGFDETVRGHLYEINRESRRLAVEVEGYLKRNQ